MFYMLGEDISRLHETDPLRRRPGPHNIRVDNPIFFLICINPANIELTGNLPNQYWLHFLNNLIGQTYMIPKLTEAQIAEFSPTLSKPDW